MFRARSIVARIQLVHPVLGQMTSRLLSPDEATQAAEELSRRFGDAIDHQPFVDGHVPGPLTGRPGGWGPARPSRLPSAATSTRPSVTLEATRWHVEGSAGGLARASGGRSGS